ncbi:MAG: hypothetical protein HY000_25950 [Planctomycetes bacterium]|nr:hypothetical protein [Planctomycetota bacterium]
MLATRVALMVGRRFCPARLAALQQKCRRIRWQLLSSAISLTLALGTGELAARMWLPTPPLEWLHDYSTRGFDPTDWQTLFCEFDPVLGWRGAAHRSGWHSRPGFRVWVDQNSAGFRDVEHTRDPSGHERVFVLGDSFVWGCGVEQEETITARMHQFLPGIDVYNLGVCGYGTDQSLMNLRCWADTWQPNWVCYLFFPNDISDNQAAFKHGHHKPRFALVDGRLRLEYPSCPPEAEAASALDASKSDDPLAPAALLRHPALSLCRVADYYISPHAVLYRRLRRLPQGSVPRIATVGLDPLTQALVVEMNRECEQRGTGFTIALVPDRRVMKHSDPSRYFAPVRDWCRQQKIDCLDLTEALARSPGQPYLAEGHWNATGHQVAARALAEHLQTLGWQTRGSGVQISDLAGEEAIGQ